MSWNLFLLFITKNHISIKDRKKLTLSQIFNKISLSPAAFKENQEKAFKQNGVELKENTPQDIKDLVIEMSERVGGTWKEHASDMKLQKQFWQIFLKSVYEKNFYKKRNGNFKAKFGSTFLKKNLELLN